MSGQARRDNPGRSHLVESPVHPEEPEFRLEVQPVPALRLDRRDPEGDHPGQEFARPREQRLLVERARGPHRGFDPASGCGDLQVTAPPDAVGELPRPPAAEGEMRVCVHESGDDEPSAGAPGGLRLVLGRQRSGGPGPADNPIPPHERGVPDEPDVVLAGRVRAGGEAADVCEARHGGERAVTRAWGGRPRALGRCGSPPDTPRPRVA